MVHDKLIKSEAENIKYKNMLTGANKAMRFKELSIKSKTEEVTKLEGIIQQFSQLKDGKKMSISAIRELGDKPQVTVQVVASQGTAQHPEQTTPVPHPTTSSVK